MDPIFTGFCVDIKRRWWNVLVSPVQLYGRRYLVEGNVIKG